MTVPESGEVENERLRWARAVAWARGPWWPQQWSLLAEKVNPDEASLAEYEAWYGECCRIAVLAHRIEEVGEEQAWAEYEARRNGAGS